MAKSRLLICFLAIVSSHIISAGDRSKKSAIRRVLPAAAAPDETWSSDVCLSNFQVRDTTIIRTQDSRSLGAKYLNETELPSKEECMKWCCDTNNCNVAVYDGKNKGSCYIFDCSPMGEFKCRFTTHDHYTSAILKINRHTDELDKWGSEVKHEEELRKLRDEDTTLSTTSSAFTVTTTAPTTMATQPTTIGATQIAATSFVSPVIPAQKTAVVDDRHCSRYQFECRNTSECIAIYNACDGIPQCSDASDESVELGCPVDTPRRNKANEENEQLMMSSISKENLMSGDETINNRITTPPKNYPYSASKLQQQLQQQRQLQQQLRQQQIQQQQQLQQQQQQQKQQQQYSKNKPIAVDNRLPSSVFAHKNGGLLQAKANYEDQLNKNYQRPMPPAHGPYIDPYVEGTRDYSAESASGPGYNNAIVAPQSAGVNYGNQDYDTAKATEYWPQDNNAAYERPRVSPGGDHSVAHEGNMAQSYSHGRPEKHGQLQNNNEVSAVDPQMASYYGEQKPLSPRGDYGNYPENVPSKSAHTHEHNRNFANHPHHPQTEHKEKTVEPVLNEDTHTEPKIEIPDNKKLPETPKENHASQETQEETESRTPAPPPPQTSTQLSPRKMSPGDSHAQLNKVEVNLAEVEMQALDRTSETNGAVLALTLGLTITGVLLVLVGCRLRMVRRHLRRGRSPFTHDADYLVNGMYL